MTAVPIFPATFDCDFLKILDENLMLILHEIFKHPGFDEIQVCSVCCSVFGWWQWHLFDFVLVDVWIADGLIGHHFGLTH